MDISGSLEDLQDQNVIVYLLRIFRDKYYSRVRGRRPQGLGLGDSGTRTSRRSSFRNFRA